MWQKMRKTPNIIAPGPAAGALLQQPDSVVIQVNWCWMKRRMLDMGFTEDSMKLANAARAQTCCLSYKATPHSAVLKRSTPPTCCSSALCVTTRPAIHSQVDRRDIKPQELAKWLAGQRKPEGIVLQYRVMETHQWRAPEHGLRVYVLPGEKDAEAKLAIERLKQGSVGVLSH